MTATNTLPTGPQSISLDTAVEMTTRFRSEKEAILAPAYQGRDILCNSETFNRAAIDRLLALDGCEGLRIYYGMDESLQVHAILAGVTEGNEDILPSAGASLQDDTGDISEEGQRCPPLCPPPSALNP